MAELALRRFEEERRGRGMFRGGTNDPYQRIVKHFVATGNRVNAYDIASVGPGPFAIPRSILQKVEGETTMSWTGFVFEMRDGKHFAFGTTFLAEFFSLPPDYQFGDVVQVHNHSYVTSEGDVRSLTQGMSALPTDYDASLVFREQPYFVCNYDA